MEPLKLSKKKDRSTLFNDTLIQFYDILKVTKLHPSIQQLFELRAYYEDKLSEQREKIKDKNQEIKELKDERKQLKEELKKKCQKK